MSERNHTTELTLLGLMSCLIAAHLIFSWQTALYIALLIGLAGLGFPSLSEKFVMYWEKMTRFLGKVVSTVLLTLVFYFVLFPVSIISRFFRKDPLMLSGKFHSYFIDVRREPRKEDFEKTW